jgi:hypothetical protein
MGLAYISVDGVSSNVRRDRCRFNPDSYLVEMGLPQCHLHATDCMIAYLHSEAEGDEFDNKFRAFGNITAIRLWQTMAPFSANAAAAIFEIDGRQNRVTVAGGTSASQLSSGVCVAFAQPE